MAKRRLLHYHKLDGDLDVTVAAPPIINANGMAYDNSFFDSMADGSLISARMIVPVIQELLSVESVVDIGCGRGEWLSVFANYGANRIIGYDGEYVDRSRLMIPQKCFRSADIAKGVPISERFDLAVCLEVGEHLPAAAAPLLIDTLTSAAPVVLFSAALPGQGGTHHINEQWPSYWTKLFKARNYIRLDVIRPRIWTDKRIEWWYRQNIVLFCYADFLQSSPALLAAHKSLGDTDIQLIHDEIMDRLSTVRGLTFELMRAVRRSINRRLFGP